MKKNVLIETVLVMAWHGFMVAERENASREIKDESVRLADATKEMLKDFREHGQFTKEDY